MDGTIIVADDDRTIRTVLTQALTRAGCRVRSTGSAATLWRWVEEGEGDVVVTDVMMPDGNGLDLLPSIQKKRPELPVLVISAQNTVMTAIKASESGAYDYLPKPFDLRELMSRVSRALSQKTFTAAPAKNPTVRNDQGLPLVGGSPAMQEVYRIVARVLNTDLNVLIIGETGTGKNLLAETLHSLGNRSENAMITVNCGLVSPQELTQQVEKASLGGGATIYLDEVGELSADSQLQLLGLLHSTGSDASAARFLSSTSRNLNDLVNEGLFREDLFYRLSVIPVTLPPLRARLDDIAELTANALRNCAAEGMPAKTISKSALDRLRQARWPGNVRGLENFVRRMVVLCNEEEITDDFVSETLKSMPQSSEAANAQSGQKLSSSVETHIRRYFDQHGDTLPPPGLYNRILREVELPLIALSLSATRGNQIKAAELLGINRNTLRKKIRDLDIQVTRSKKMM